MSTPARGKLHAKVQAKVKDASTRFMRVEELGSVPTVAMPAAQLLAAAAATRREPDGDTTRAIRLDAPTRAVPLAVVARQLAPTVALAPLEVRPKHSVPSGRAPVDRTVLRRPPWSSRFARVRVPVSIVVLVASAIASLLVLWAHHEPRNPMSTQERSRAVVQAAGVPTSTEPSHPSPPMPVIREATLAPDPGPVAVLPTTAADQLAAGDHQAALTSYRALARAHPEQPAFALVAAVLERRQRTGCAGDTEHGGASCAP